MDMGMALKRMSRTVPAGPLLSGLFWATAALEGYLLATDAFLREAQPLHALALATFIGVDVALASIIWGDVGLALPLALPWAMLQVVALLANPLSGPQVGMNPATFAAYLFSLSAYKAILVSRVAEALLAAGLLARRGSVLDQVVPRTLRGLRHRGVRWPWTRRRPASNRPGGPRATRP